MNATVLAAASPLLAIAVAAMTLCGAAHGSADDPAPKSSRPRQHKPPKAAKTPTATFRITSAPPRIDPVLLRAYATLHAGDLDAAASDYALVLEADANNADALHGLAVVALRRRQFGTAEDFYERAIRTDPRDAFALAGLYGLRGDAALLDAESHLKTLIAEQPWQHVLHFALGNVYAAAGRWSEAQQAYFSASSGANERPDYLFNLAVSLDHLHQSALAAQYYDRAIAAAERHPASFDVAHAVSRRRELLP